MFKRISLSILLAALCASLLTGCGGGGGGSSIINLVVSSDWSQLDRGITGKSMKWSLYDSAETLQRAIALSDNGSLTQQALISNLAKGQYHLKVELYEDPDLGGSVVGVLDEAITLNSSRTYTAVANTDPDSIKVTPQNVTLKTGQSRRFYAAGYNAQKKATFISPGSFAWSTTGGVATVGSDGLLLGTSAGNGTVVASATGLEGSTSIKVEENQITQSKWTVLVYMNAANDLYTFSETNVNQMETVAGNPDVRFVVQWKQSTDRYSGSTFNGTRRYLVRPDNTSNIVSDLVQDMGTNVDMGSKTTLHDFIEWGKTNYPADRYVLIIWNHGNGWKRGIDQNYPTRGVSYDDETGNSIQTWELAQALGSNHFDIIAWDASLMQMIEVADEIRDQADYVVGSEESPPGEGYPYDLVFQGFRDNPDATTLSLSKGFVDGMLAGYAGSPTKKITQSVLDTSEISNLNAKISALAQVLIDNKSALELLIAQVRTNAKSFSPLSNRVYRDLWDVCDRLQTGSSIAEVQSACADVKAAIELAVKWEGHNTTSNGSHGVSIDFSSATTFSGFSDDYVQLRFSNETLWDEWLTVAP